ncbi:CPBP family intramembrane glutamic endopeptidase [Arthrobacter rhombi]|uniref:lysostaphin resistance A-like protein n=1 Tax=Arthrobacter rhombi TaxID=71253 RepID=UPI003FD36961
MHPTTQPAAPGPSPRAPRSRRNPRFLPGGFRVGDAVMVLAYGVLFVAGGASLLTLFPGFTDVFSTAETASAAVNFIVYAVLFCGAMIMAFPTLKHSFGTFKFSPWAKVFMIPGAWVANLVVTTIVIMSLGGGVKSENQLAIEGMTTTVPFTTMLVMAVVMGPFVEEYIFRHLLIGKLSRKLNVWVCVVISIILFAGMHFLGSGSFELIAAVPYLSLGAVISVAYVLSGRSLAYSYLIHLLNNLIALTVAYYLLPLVPQI